MDQVREAPTARAILAAQALAPFAHDPTLAERAEAAARGRVAVRAAWAKAVERGAE